MSKKEKSFILSSIENFWYYYKWHFLGGIVIFFSVIIVMLNFSDVKEPSDVDILTLYARPLTTSEKYFEDGLDNVIEDVDKNGTKHIEINTLFITESGTSSEDLMDKSKFEGIIAYAQADLVLLDGTNLDRFKSKDFLAPLEDFMDISEIDSEDLIYRDGKAVAVRLSDSKHLKDMQYIIDDVYAGVMFVPEESEEEIPARRKNATNIIKELIKKD